MDLHRFGDKVRLLEVSTPYFTFILNGPFEDLKAKTLKYNQNYPATLNIDKQIPDEVSVRTCTSQRDLVRNESSIMRPSFFENGSYELILESHEDKAYSISHMGESLDKVISSFSNLKVGTISFNADIGFSTFEIYKNTKKLISITIEVFPSKMDYMSDYQKMIQEVNEEICALAFGVWDQTYLKTQLVDTPCQTNIEYIHILKVIFDELLKSIARIEKNPKHIVVTREERKGLARSKHWSRKTMQHLRKHTEYLAPDLKGVIVLDGKRYMPLEVISKKKITTIDIYENQYVKYMVRMMVKRLRKIEEVISQKEYVSYKNFIRQKREILEGHLKNFFVQISDLKDRQSMSLVFQMAPAYKKVYEKFMLLKKGLDLGADLYQITPKKIYKLYEIWCYMKLHHILTDLGYNIEEYGILKYKDNGLHLALIEDEQAKICYGYKNEKIELWYNKSYSKLPTTQQRPDTVLCIQKQSEGGEERIYLFDAKYRMQVTKQGVVGPMEEDINVMHRYRDAIVSRLEGKQQFKYDTFGAYVMFPYWDEDCFVHHPFYKSIDEVNIGALPMLPGSTNLMTKRLKEILEDTLLEAKNRRVTMDIHEDYAKFKMENVMVVNVMNEAHFEKYMKYQFYHIPATYLSNVRLGVTYLAFYQSKKAFGEEAGIHYYAKIKEVRRYKRGECMEMPKQKGQEEIYLRFELEEIKAIGPVVPIQSGTQLVSYTTLYLLENASNMHELKVKSSMEIEVYKKLRKEAIKREWKIRKQNDVYYVGQHQVEVIDGKDVKVDGKIILGKAIFKDLF